ncbi:MAG: hypothetical protein A2051_04815 [Desulfovibrionales bacterium GWA2_65_9]|nr:MAG: hypothetical protein A2051_04815 [Desulfovibrionales bacterium GWA2_65_9]
MALEPGLPGVLQFQPGRVVHGRLRQGLVSSKGGLGLGPVLFPVRVLACNLGGVLRGLLNEQGAFGALDGGERVAQGAQGLLGGHAAFGGFGQGGLCAQEANVAPGGDGQGQGRGGGESQGDLAPDGYVAHVVLLRGGSFRRVFPHLETPPYPGSELEGWLAGESLVTGW